MTSGGLRTMRSVPEISRDGNDTLPLAAHRLSRERRVYILAGDQRQIRQ